VISYEWRGLFDNAALNALHAQGVSHKVLDDDWWAQGVGTPLVEVAVRECRATECEWRPTGASTALSAAGRHAL
jgi:GNAT superfamily N-acetyltransferase